MSSYRDTMQVCLNGHVINERYHRSPQFRKKFCTECGEKTVTECENCLSEIPGDLIFENVAVIMPFEPEKFAPKICAECGHKFPWYENRVKRDEELSAKRKLKAEEKKFEKTLETMKKIEVKIEGHGNVVNMGSIVESVISNSVKLTNAGDKEIAIALENLTNAITTERDLDDSTKQKYLEQINTLSEEALKPLENRLPKSVLETIINFGLETLNAAGNVAGVWSVWSQTIKTFFLH